MYLNTSETNETEDRISIGNPQIVQTKFGAVLVEKFSEGIYVANMWKLSRVGRTVSDALTALEAAAHNELQIRRENF